MAREELVRFFGEVLKRPDVKATLDPLAGEELVAAAVKAGIALDCAFTAEDFRDAMRAVAARRAAAAELSEQQLESVAGGRMTTQAKEDQKYMIYKFNDLLITGVQ
jgi:hypothetical protein